MHGPLGKPIASACSRLLPYFVQLALQEAALVRPHLACTVRPFSVQAAGKCPEDHEP